MITTIAAGFLAAVAGFRAPSTLPVEHEKGYLWLEAESFVDYGECILSREDCRQIVAEAFEHFNGSRYALHSYIVMPNHVHVLVEFLAKEDMPKILHSWKSYTASAINRVLGRTGSVWQRDYFDRLVRNADHYGRCLAYIRKNESAARKLWGEGK